MKRVTCTVTGLFPDTVTETDMYETAFSAFVQWHDPEEIPSPEAVEYAVRVEDLDEYGTACAKATARQELLPLVAELLTAGIPHRVEQTGGFTMVVVVPVDDGVYALTNDGARSLTGTTQYCVGYYPGSTWHDGEHDDIEYHNLSAAEFIEPLLDPRTS